MRIRSGNSETNFNSYYRMLLWFIPILILVLFGAHSVYGAAYRNSVDQIVYTRKDVFAIEKFENFKTTIRVNITYQQGYPASSVTLIPFWLEFIENQSLLVDVSGGTCAILDNNYVQCNGQTTYLMLSYVVTLPLGPQPQFEGLYKLPRISPPELFVEFNAFDNGIAYTLEISYPSSFQYVRSTIIPDMVDAPQNRLRWSQESMFSFKPEVTFSVNGLSRVWLPLIRR